MASPFQRHLDTRSTSSGSASVAGQRSRGEHAKRRPRQNLSRKVAEKTDVEGSLLGQNPTFLLLDRTRQTCYRWIGLGKPFPTVPRYPTYLSRFGLCGRPKIESETDFSCLLQNLGGKVPEKTDVEGSLLGQNPTFLLLDRTRQTCYRWIGLGKPFLKVPRYPTYHPGFGLCGRPKIERRTRKTTTTAKSWPKSTRENRRGRLAAPPKSDFFIT